MQTFSTADTALAQRIEAGHAASGRAAATESEPVAGGWAVFAGIGSSGTQALGIGTQGPVTPEELDRLETFFRDRHSPAVIDVCALAHPSVFELLQHRRYVVREVSNVLARALPHPEPPPHSNSPIELQPVEPAESEAWVRLVLEGFLDGAPIPEDHVAGFSARTRNFHAFFGLQNGARVATAAMDIQNGLATLFGDATILTARGQGVQRSLIHHRLSRAAHLACDLASASVLPGSISHRNYERAGFQLLYARIMMAL